MKAIFFSQDTVTTFYRWLCYQQFKFSGDCSICSWLSSYHSEKSHKSTCNWC